MHRLRFLLRRLHIEPAILQVAFRLLERCMSSHVLHYIQWDIRLRHRGEGTAPEARLDKVHWFELVAKLVLQVVVIPEEKLTAALRCCTRKFEDAAAQFARRFDVHCPRANSRCCLALSDCQRNELDARHRVLHHCDIVDRNVADIGESCSR